jgi:hypothetical protein
MNRVLTLIGALLLALYCEIAPATLIAAGPSPPERSELPNSITLEGVFGKAEIDFQSPRMLTLFLRQPDGTLSAKSLLCACESEYPAWAVGGVTHARGTSDVHYSSRYSTGHTY